MNADFLLTHFDRLAAEPGAIPKLRRLVLDLAVRGKLVAQEAGDEPADKLLERIAAEKKRLVETGEVKRLKKAQPLDPDDLWLELPAGWAWSQLAEIGFINPRNEADAAAEAGFVPMPLIPAEWGVSHTSEPRNWAEIKKQYTHFADGDIALAKITPCFENGKSTIFEGLPGGFGAGTTELHVVRPLFVERRYLLAFLKCPHFIETGIPRMTGTAGQKRVPSGYFANYPLPLPPLAEQRRIVARVDALMARLDALEEAQAAREAACARFTAASHARLSTPDPETFKADAGAALDALTPLTTRPAQVDALRLTILSLAVRGKLVAQDPADEPAVVTRLGELIELVSGQHLKPGDYNSDGIGIPYITGPADFRTDGLEITRHTKVRRAVALAGDLLLTVKGSGVGKCHLCQLPEVAISRQLMALRPTLIDSDFLALVAHDLAESLKPKSRSLIPGIGRRDVLGFELLLPPLAEQRRIVETADRLMALCNRLEAALKTAETTRAALLDAAIRDALQPAQEAMEAVE